MRTEPQAISTSLVLSQSDVETKMVQNKLENNKDCDGFHLLAPN